jgi:isocitrate dehydrogenase (NAD+)
VAATRVTLIHGDGIGPDIVDAARRIVDATGAGIEWIPAVAGQAAHQEVGDPLPQATLDAVTETGVALKGPCATPVGAGFRSVNVALRKHFDLFANVRPAIAFDGVDCLFPGLDLVVVRENTEGLYSGMEHWIGPGRQAGMAIGVNTRPNMERICRHAFEHARTYGRRKVTAVHKANILKILSGLFLEVAREVAPDYPDIEFEDRIVDNMCMQMVRDPRQFDVILSTNLFGDILSDLAAGLVGGLGLAPGANLGEKVAIFEAVHGTAPDLAGRDLANPVSVVLAAAMMLRYLGKTTEADRVEGAVRAVLAEGRQVTRDLDPENGVSTSEMTRALVAALA